MNDPQKLSLSFRAILAFFATILLIGIGSPLLADDTAERIEILPTDIKLSSLRETMQLLVTAYHAGDQLRDATRDATFTSTNEEVIKIQGTEVFAVGNGSADIIVKLAALEQSIPVTVTGVETADSVSFQHEVLPTLTRLKCNSGACHGSPSGKGGFRLSLAAYDIVLDRLSLIRESQGRRANILDPGRSLMLLKPTMTIPHGGGLRLMKNNHSYRVLRNWIKEGCKVDPEDSPECVKLELLPHSGRLLKRPHDAQQLLVLAHFSDGSIRDVTKLTRFDSSDEAVATVSANGLVAGIDRGNVAITARFLVHLESCQLIFVKDVEGFAWNNPSEANYIDTHVHSKLQQLQFLASDLCTEDEFLRRVYFDTIGILPTVEEAETYLADSSPDKRSQLIDTLLERPEYSRFWALRWSDLLRLKKSLMTDRGVFKFYEWIVTSLRDDMPLSEFAVQLLTARGSTFENPAANYYRALKDMNECTEATSQLFLGARLQCAKCHNHPFERWTQDNYYGISAFFNRVQRKDGARAGEMVVWMAREGDVIQPRTGQKMKPWLPAKGDVEVDGNQDPRDMFAEWLTAPDNPFFCRVAVNRIWAHTMGRGIVEPVDDFRDSNPPSNAELLDALANDFREGNFQQKHILRVILNSHTYQRSSRTTEFNRDDNKYFSHARRRLLGAEQLLDAICHLTGVPESFAGLPEGTRATQLPSPPGHEFLDVFGQPQRTTTCACERTSESNLSQAIQLFNGKLIHGKLTSEQNRFRKLIEAEKSDEEVIRHLYLAGFSRPPQSEELEAAKNHIQSKEDRVAAFEDICWALINTNEFLHQH